MRREPRLTLTLSLVLLAAAGLGCGKKPAPEPAAAPAPAVLQVTAVELGSAITSDNRVTVPTDSFRPGDTIYAVVLTSGSSASATLTARFTYEDGQLVAEPPPQQIAPTGPAATEFHISKPDGWPAGGYQVEIGLDGIPVGTRAFRVEA